MRIVNVTKNSVLAENAALADRLLSRIMGLLGKDELRPGEALILKPCNSIHTFFMRFPIDVLFVDKNNRVIRAIPHLKPYRLTNIYFNAILAIELPVRTIQASYTQTRDTLSLD